MSIGSILGFLIGIGLFVLAIVLKTNNLWLFFDLSSVVIVLGGTFSSCYLGYQARYVNLALKDLLTIFFRPPSSRESLPALTANIVRWATINASDGLRSLEKEIKKEKNEIVHFGIELVLSGYNGDEVRYMMNHAVQAQFQRRAARFNILKNMGAMTPAFGMIGTLVGLVVMLDSLVDNPEGVGPGLAVALITTLYGVLFARLLFIPAATKLQQQYEIQMFVNYLSTEALIMIADNAKPSKVADRINSFLDPVLHINSQGQLVRAKKGKRSGGGGKK